MNVSKLRTAVILSCAGLITWAVTSVDGTALGVSQHETSHSSSSSSSPPQSPAPAVPRSDDGYDELPSRLKGFSYTTLVMAGVVHPVYVPVEQAAARKVPYQQSTSTNITWSPPVNISNYSSGTFGSVEPSAAMHPTNSLLALSGGPWKLEQIRGQNRIENSLDGGQTWIGRFTQNSCDFSSDGVAAWASELLNSGNTALYSEICINDVGGDLRYYMRLNRSTDAGVTWAAFNSNIDQSAWCPRCRESATTIVSISGQTTIRAALTTAGPTLRRFLVLETRRRHRRGRVSGRWAYDGLMMEVSAGASSFQQASPKNIGTRNT